MPRTRSIEPIRPLAEVAGALSLLRRTGTSVVIYGIAAGLLIAVLIAPLVAWAFFQLLSLSGAGAVERNLLGLMAGPNRYCYVESNPTTLADPLGPSPLQPNNPGYIDPASVPPDTDGNAFEVEILVCAGSGSIPGGGSVPVFGHVMISFVRTPRPRGVPAPGMRILAPAPPARSLPSFGPSVVFGPTDHEPTGGRLVVGVLIAPGSSERLVDLIGEDAWKAFLEAKAVRKEGDVPAERAEDAPCRRREIAQGRGRGQEELGLLWERGRRCVGRDPLRAARHLQAARRRALRLAQGRARACRQPPYDRMDELTPRGWATDNTRSVPTS